MKIEEGHFTQVDYPFKIEPNYSTLSSIIQISRHEFYPKEGIGALFGFNATTKYEKYNLSPNPVDILSFDKTSKETDIARGMIFRSKGAERFHNFTMDVDLGNNQIEKLLGN